MLPARTIILYNSPLTIIFEGEVSEYCHNRVLANYQLLMCHGLQGSSFVSCFNSSGCELDRAPFFDMRLKNAIKSACQSPDTFQDEPPPS